MYDKVLSKGDVNMRWVLDGKIIYYRLLQVVNRFELEYFQNFLYIFFNLKKFLKIYEKLKLIKKKLNRKRNYFK